MTKDRSTVIGDPGVAGAQAEGGRGRTWGPEVRSHDTRSWALAFSRHGGFSERDTAGRVVGKIVLSYTAHL